MFFKSDNYDADEDRGAGYGAGRGADEDRGADYGTGRGGDYGADVNHDADFGGESDIIKRACAFLKNNAGRFFGGIAGLITAILILTIGFWKTLLIDALVFSGACIGGYKDGRGALYRILTWYKNRKR